MSTLATMEMDWKTAANGWQYAKPMLDGVEIVLIRKGRTCAILVPGLAQYFGATRNRLSVPNYRTRVGHLISDCHVGYGVSPSSKSGIVKAVYATNVKAALSAVNIKADPDRLTKLMGLMLAATHKSPADETMTATTDGAVTAIDATGAGWVNGDQAKEMWDKALRRIAILDLPLAKLLQATTTVFAYSPKTFAVNLMGSSQALALLWKDQKKQTRIEQAISDVTGIKTTDMRINFYSGTLGRGPLSHLDGSNAQPSLLPRAKYEDEVPFDGPVYEEQEEREVITSDDLILDTSNTVSIIAQDVKDLADDLGGLETKLDRYATLVARRNQMLASILESVAEVLRANLCTPDEQANGRYKQQGPVDA